MAGRHTGPPSRHAVREELRTLRRRAALDGDGDGAVIEVWEVTAGDDGTPERVGDAPALTVPLGPRGASDE